MQFFKGVTSCYTTNTAFPVEEVPISFFTNFVLIRMVWVFSRAVLFRTGATTYTYLFELVKI